MKNADSKQQLEKQITYAIARYALARQEIEEWGKKIDMLRQQIVDNPVGCADP